MKEKEDISVSMVFSIIINRIKLLSVLSLILCGVLYVFSFLIKPTYEANVTVLPSHQLDIAKLNVYRSAESFLRLLRVDDLFSPFRAHLTSLSNINHVLSQFPGNKVNYILTSLGGVELSVRGNNPEILSQVLTKLIENSVKFELLSLNEKLTQELNLLKESIEANKNQGESPQILALKKEVLDEAYQIAKNANIKKPLSEHIALKPDFISTNSNYLRGYEAIGAELKFLEDHHVDPRKIYQIEQMQKQYDYAKSILPLKSGVTFFNSYPRIIEVTERSSKRNYFIFSFLGGFLLMVISIALYDINFRLKYKSSF